MEIKYDLSENDILALMQYRLRFRRGKQNPILVRRVAYLVGFTAMALGSWLLMHQATLLIVFLMLAIASFLLYLPFSSWLARRRVTSIYRDPQKRATLASRILRADSEGLEEISGAGEAKLKWEVVTDIAVTSTHAFVSVLNDPTIIIPKESLGLHDFQSFVDFCCEHIKRNAT